MTMEIKGRDLVKLSLCDKVKDKALINVDAVFWQYSPLSL